LILYPITFIGLQKESWKPLAHFSNRIWAGLFFPIVGMPIQIKYEFKPDPKQAYVFCANHFSYLDIAVMMGVVSNYFAFMGKSSVKNIPLFGYMFAKLHIQVDRDDRNSRIKALTRSIKALKSGRSIMIFPEGGIHSTDIPNLHLPLKDGAFSMAVENQVPIVPVSLLTNYKIMPDVWIKWNQIKVVIHQPIETKGKTKVDIEALKKEFIEKVQKNFIGKE
jgi:1-acyl-sn-glycerol-3-phosphate acyltransferase